MRAKTKGIDVLHEQDAPSCLGEESTRKEVFGPEVSMFLSLRTSAGIVCYISQLQHPYGVYSLLLAIMLCVTAIKQLMVLNTNPSLSVIQCNSYCQLQLLMSLCHNFINSPKHLSHPWRVYSQTFGAYEGYFATEILCEVAVSASEESLPGSHIWQLYDLTCISL